MGRKTLIQRMRGSGNSATNNKGTDGSVVSSVSGSVGDPPSVGSRYSTPSSRRTVFSSMRGNSTPSRSASARNIYRSLNSPTGPGATSSSASASLKSPSTNQGSSSRKMQRRGSHTSAPKRLGNSSKSKSSSNNFRSSSARRDKQHHLDASTSAASSSQVSLSPTEASSIYSTPKRRPRGPSVPTTKGTSAAGHFRLDSDKQPLLVSPTAPTEAATPSPSSDSSPVSKLSLLQCASSSELYQRTSRNNNRSASPSMQRFRSFRRNRRRNTSSRHSSNNSTNNFRSLGKKKETRQEDYRNLPVVDTSQDASFRNRVSKDAAQLDRLGNSYFERGNYDQAFLCYERALKLKRVSLRTHPHANLLTETEAQKASIMASVATSINNMTYLRQRSGNATADETMASYLKSLQIKRDILGPDHLSVGKTLNNIGSVFYLKREFVPALKAYENAKDIMSAQLGEEHLDVGTVISNIGDVHCAMNNAAEALLAYRRALDIRWSRLGPNDPKVIRLMEQTASLETGKQPQKDAEYVSDSEDEEFVEEDKKREEAFQEEVRILRKELAADIKYFDLVERNMEIEMIRDKVRFLRAMRELQRNPPVLQDITETYLKKQKSKDEADIHEDDEENDDSSVLSVASAPASIEMPTFSFDLEDDDDDSSNPANPKHAQRPPRAPHAHLTEAQRGQALASLRTRLEAIKDSRRTSRPQRRSSPSPSGGATPPAPTVPQRQSPGLSQAPPTRSSKGGATPPTPTVPKRQSPGVSQAPPTRKSSFSKGGSAPPLSLSKTRPRPVNLTKVPNKIAESFATCETNLIEQPPPPQCITPATLLPAGATTVLQ